MGSVSGNVSIESGNKVEIGASAVLAACEKIEFVFPINHAIIRVEY